jgi:hypothetical protein
MSLVIRFLRCVAIAVLIWLAVPFLYNVLPAGRASDQVWLDARIADINAIRVNVPVSDELDDLLAYVVRRYNKIGRFNVAIRHIPLVDAVGINAPWCPGITLEPGLVEGDNIMGANILIHEAVHDYYPYFGHSHVDPIMEECMDAQVKSWDIVRKSRKVERRSRRDDR